MHITIATIALTLTQTRFYIDVILVTIASISCIYYYRLHVLKSLSWSVLVLRLSSDGDWSIETGDGVKNVHLDMTSYISHFILLLNFRLKDTDTRRYTVLVSRDMVDIDNFRHLMVRLKTSRDT